MSSHETPLTYDRREPYFERRYEAYLIYLIIRRVSFAKIISQTHSNYTHGILHVFLGLLGLCTFIGLKGKNQISKGELPFKLVYVSSWRWKQ